MANVVTNVANDSFAIGDRIDGVRAHTCRKGAGAIGRVMTDDCVNENTYVWDMSGEMLLIVTGVSTCYVGPVFHPGAVCVSNWLQEKSQYKAGHWADRRVPHSLPGNSSNELSSLIALYTLAATSAACRLLMLTEEMRGSSTIWTQIRSERRWSTELVTDTITWRAQC